MDQALAGISAAQIAQLKEKDQALNQPKLGPSKFDETLGSAESSEINAPDEVGEAQEVDGVRMGEQPNSVDRTQAPTPADRVSDVTASTSAVSGKAESRSTRVLTQILTDMEKGQGVMDKLIDQGLSGKRFSNSELLALQAGMYRYTQELELTGKVVEKATTGLKETLKTQV